MKWGENSAIELLHIKKIVQKESFPFNGDQRLFNYQLFPGRQSNISSIVLRGTKLISTFSDKGGRVVRKQNTATPPSMVYKLL